MDRSLKRKVVAGTVAALAVGGTGAGIAATQLRSSPSEESQAIVKQVAEAHGGQVVAERAEGGGTVMRLRLNGRSSTS